MKIKTLEAIKELDSLASMYKSSTSPEAREHYDYYAKILIDYTCEDRHREHILNYWEQVKKMKKRILVLGSSPKQEEYSQHNPEEDFFYGDYEFYYVDLFNDADLIYDLNNFPYPFENEEFDGIFASHIIEHIYKEKFLVLMKELHRITKKDSQIVIYVPHASGLGSFTHPTHYNYFSYGTFDSLCDDILTLEKYFVNMFSLDYKKLKFPRRFFFLNFLKPSTFETWFSGIFHAHEIKFILIKK